MAKLLHENYKPHPLPEESLVHVTLSDALKSLAVENLRPLPSALLTSVLTGSFEH